MTDLLIVRTQGFEVILERTIQGTDLRDGVDVPRGLVTGIRIEPQPEATGPISFIMRGREIPLTGKLSDGIVTIRLVGQARIPFGLNEDPMDLRTVWNRV